MPQKNIPILIPLLYVHCPVLVMCEWGLSSPCATADLQQGASVRRSAPAWTLNLEQPTSLFSSQPIWCTLPPSRLSGLCSGVKGRTPQLGQQPFLGCLPLGQHCNNMDCSQSVTQRLFNTRMQADMELHIPFHWWCNHQIRSERSRGGHG